MKPEMQDKIFQAIEAQNLSHEKAEQAKALFTSLLNTPPKTHTAPQNIDYYKLTLALCAAALCVGQPVKTLSVSAIRSTAFMMTKALFTEDGEIVPGKFDK
jgi:hypothetical protein